jgi:hypothetical protein
MVLACGSFPSTCYLLWLTSSACLPHNPGKWPYQVLTIGSVGSGALIRQSKSSFPAVESHENSRSVTELVGCGHCSAA